MFRLKLSPETPVSYIRSIKPWLIHFWSRSLLMCLGKCGCWPKDQGASHQHGRPQSEFQATVFGLAQLHPLWLFCMWTSSQTVSLSAFQINTSCFFFPKYRLAVNQNIHATHQTVSRILPQKAKWELVSSSHMGYLWRPPSVTCVAADTPLLLTRTLLAAIFAEAGGRHLNKAAARLLNLMSSLFSMPKHPIPLQFNNEKTSLLLSLGTLSLLFPPTAV